MNSNDGILDRFRESLNFEFKLPQIEIKPGSVLTYLVLDPRRISLPKSLSFSLSRDHYDALYDGVFIGSARGLLPTRAKEVVLRSRAERGLGRGENQR